MQHRRGYHSRGLVAIVTCMDETFPERLKRLRLEAGLTQQDLADFVGRSRPWITQLETGTRWEGKLPPADDLALLARALGVRMSVLAGEEDQGPEEVRPALLPYEDLLRRIGAEHYDDDDDVPLYEDLVAHAGGGGSFPGDAIDALP